MPAFCTLRRLFVIRPCFRTFFTGREIHLSFATMSNNATTYSLSSVVSSLNRFASPALAESWDNVGLLVEPSSPPQIKKVLLTNDLTEDVLKEAVESGAQLIVSYHPPIFAPLKSVTGRSWKERIVRGLLENKIALYSPHTAWDAVKGGVNDWLASAFGEEGVTVKPIQQYYEDGPTSHTVNVTFSDLDSAKKCKQEITCISSTTLCNIIPLDGCVALEAQCSKANISQFIHFMNAGQSLRVEKNEKVPRQHHGAGRIVTLEHRISLDTAVRLVKDHLNLKDVSLAVARGKGLESLVSSIALCAGSGASILKGLNADLYLTGEMQHHDVLDAVHNGTHVLLTRHSNSERGFLKVAADGPLQVSLPGVEFIISQQDRDPLVTV